MTSSEKMSPTELLAWLWQHEFLSPPQVDEIRSLLGNYADSHALAKEMIRRDWLTPYQVNQILQGKHDQLVLRGYLLRERLGEGAMGQVFKAWQPRLRRTVAVKTLHKEHVNSPKSMERFRREVDTASQLDHPNIAHVSDADEGEGRPFMVMEFIEGINLSHRVKQQGPLSIHEAIEYARQAALGLQHAYEKGIVHRDIKPANLIVTVMKMNGEQFPLVKILDFGLARFESELDDHARLTQVGTFLGTIDYIAPEQAQNARTADIRADIYSLGCSLFYILTGQPPFSGNTVVEKIGPRLTGEPPSVRAVRPDVPITLDLLLRKIMARHPSERFQTPAELAEALQAYNEQAAHMEAETASMIVAPAVPSAPSATRPPPAAPAPVVAQTATAQPTPAGVTLPAEVPLAQPIPAMPVPTAAVPPVAQTAKAEPFLAPGEAFAEKPPAREEDPSFLEMSATGRDMSTGVAPPKAQPKKPFPTKLVLILAGGTLFFLALCLGGCLLGSFFGRDENKPNKKTSGGAIRITKVDFPDPIKKNFKPGPNKKLLIHIERVNFDGPVKVTLKDYPPGVTPGRALILQENQKSGELPFTVSYDIKPVTKKVRVVAESEIEGIITEHVLELKIVKER